MALEKRWESITCSSLKITRKTVSLEENFEYKSLENSDVSLLYINIFINTWSSVISYVNSLVNNFMSEKTRSHLLLIEFKVCIRDF